MRTLLWVWLSICGLGAASAHPLTPALLQWQVGEADTHEVIWRSSVLRVRGAEVWPEWPHGCEAQPLQEAVVLDGDALEQRWRLRCDGPMVGRTLAVRGLDEAGISVVLRVIEPRATQQTLLDARTPHWQWRAAADKGSVFARYLWLGIDHLWRGADHVLFVVGLVLLVRGARRLLLTVTAFTLGHSVTLGLAVLDRIHVNQALAEWGIALSLLVLAVALTRQAYPHRGLSRFPVTMAACFGLVHGLGFAGVLRDVGLPAGEIPLALLAFNLGIEVGQVLLIGLLLLLASVLRGIAGARLHRLPAMALLAYPMGTVAAYWLWSRTTFFG